MADIATSILEVGSNRLILQDAEAREKINEAYVTDTASGAIASFPDGADGVPVKSLTVDIEPVQSGSGDPSPDNVRPISGHTQAVVTRTGKNLLFSNTATSTVSGVTATKNSDGSWTLNGTCTEDNDLVLMSGSRISLPSGNYVLSGCPSGGSSTTYALRLRVINSDGRVYPDDRGNGKSFEATNGSYIDRVYIEVKNGYTFNDLIFYPMVRPASDTDATFEPYQGQTVTISLNGTRYGGTLDVTTGVLTVDRGYALINGDVYGLVHNGSFPNNNVEIYVMLPKKKGITNLITNRFPIVASGYDTAWTCHGVSTSKRVNFTMPPEIATKQDTVNWFTSNPTEIVYELETPVTVQLTLQEVTTLLGQNNIWADTGDTDVTYRADTKLYIEKLTAPTEDDMIADHAISANSFFMVGNNLYRATTAIASGATITVGTNATKLSLSEALNALA